MIFERSVASTVDWGSRALSRACDTGSVRSYLDSRPGDGTGGILYGIAIIFSPSVCCPDRDVTGVPSWTKFASSGIVGSWEDSPRGGWSVKKSVSISITGVGEREAAVGERTDWGVKTLILGDGAIVRIVSSYFITYWGLVSYHRLDSPSTTTDLPRCCFFARIDQSGDESCDHWRAFCLFEMSSFCRRRHAWLSFEQVPTPCLSSGSWRSNPILWVCSSIAYRWGHG